VKLDERPAMPGRLHLWSSVPLHSYTAGLDRASEFHLNKTTDDELLIINKSSYRYSYRYR